LRSATHPNALSHQRSDPGAEAFDGAQELALRERITTMAVGISESAGVFLVVLLMFKFLPLLGTEIDVLFAAGH
jgi:hypothetical protein